MSWMMNRVQLLERDKMLRIGLSVIEDDKHWRTCYIVDDRVISSGGTRARGSLLRRHNHGLPTLYELSSEHQWLVDVLDAVGIGRRVCRMSWVREVTCKVHTSTIDRRCTSTTPSPPYTAALIFSTKQSHNHPPPPGATHDEYLLGQYWWAKFVVLQVK